MEFHLLGPVELRNVGRRINLGAAKQQCLLAVLLWNTGQPIPIATLIDHLWDGNAPRHARQSIYSYVTRLRQALTACHATIERTPGGGYLLDVDPDAVDVHRFRRLVSAARATAADRTRRERLFREALALWRGTPLAGVNGCWAERVRAGLEDMRTEACLAWADAALAVGESAAVVTSASAMLGAHPLNEPLAALLMRALDSEGRQAEALACYARMRSRLRDELGTEPGPVLRGVHQRLLGDIGVAPPTSGGRQCQTDRLIGREAERVDLTRQIAEHRLVTVVGLGGGGKSTLAIHVARSLRGRFPDGVAVLDMSVLTEVREAIGALGCLLHVTPEPPEDLLSAVERALDDRRCLVVADNCEHVSTHTAAFLGRLAARCRNLTVLATSRQPLGLAGENLWRLPPLHRQAAIALFCRRAGQELHPRTMSPADHEHIAEICRLLDDLPLALELAATRLRTFPLPELTRRLHHGLDLLFRTGSGEKHRHHTLAAAIGWPFRSLPDTERRLLARLADLPDGIDLATTEAACGFGPLAPVAVAPALAALVDRCLVQPHDVDGKRWFRLPRTVRVLAGGLPTGSGEPAVGRTRSRERVGSMV
ncbi:putative ATPase/DNA-binding winged helix-turn-helix (wHTH) protein [Saccharothrix tamanrassetensis]|uniref:Putative ATPase/DNA-binding winged helix-turn-helix (WHTH) protein n=1 Tax=Saccharothrix tamanrassetensis TaxID=1051531 RepID=A0A841CR26_9PSEU|nr:BTAD domain-containing putative transcriptional regulator [Saccharothrix tamanrassetensis]MBB5959749.1 putative ATPase/DNA-binding winged helix-turn-helix (wHTH) protein [Saccharothrix tamanrassetensis]